MSAKHYIIRAVCVTLTLLTLIGCFQPPFNNFHKQVASPLRVASTITGAMRGAASKLTGIYNDNQLPIIRDLQKNDIQFVQHGDTMTLIVPTDHYFLFDSATLNDICYQGLNNIIKLLDLYPCSTVYVAAFTDDVGPVRHKKQLSQAQAETMLTFLWANNIQAVRLKAQGYGDKFNVGDNHLIHGSAFNRRIEIQWFYSPIVSRQGKMMPVDMK